MTETLVKFLPIFINKKLISLYSLFVIHISLRYNPDISETVINQLRKIAIFSENNLSFMNIIFSHFLIINFVTAILFAIAYYCCFELNLRKDKDYGYSFKKMAEKFFNSVLIFINLCYAVNIFRFYDMKLFLFYEKVITSFLDFSEVYIIVIFAIILIVYFFIEFIRNTTKNKR